MTSDDVHDNDSPTSGRQPLSQAQRKRFQKCFVHASKQASASNFDYATELFSQCALGDKDNSAYWQSLLGNLRRKYNDNKKGIKFASVRTGKERATVKKCQLQKDWDGVFKHGLEVLKLNPWDTSTLMAMAAAGEQIELDEVPLIFLHMALDADRMDPDVNRAAGHALRARQQYDQASACWLRVLEVKKDDDEARRQLGELATEKVIDKGGYEGAESSRDVKADDKTEQGQKEIGRGELTPQQKLEKAIRANPSEMGPYRELAEMLCQKEDYERAVKVLQKAYEVSNRAPDILVHLEDVEIRALRKRLRVLEAQFKKTGEKEVKEKWLEVRKQFDLKSLDRIKHLAERNPNNLTYEFQLGEAYQRVGQFKEAIEHYQKGRNDPHHRGECLLYLGQCFCQINQPRLAANNFDAALAEMGGQDPELLKDALYWAGKLAIDMKDLDKADQHLTTLAGLDFGYKEVSALLDKINELRDTE
ncbi:MAG: tetratricopeptide repeat protein [Pirellulales bacterium]|nr:tetratricopeptide repeat protein [Pirellulales bacterium]